VFGDGTGPPEPMSGAHARAIAPAGWLERLEEVFGADQRHRIDWDAAVAA